MLATEQCWPPPRAPTPSDPLPGRGQAGAPARAAPPPLGRSFARGRRQGALARARAKRDRRPPAADRAPVREPGSSARFGPAVVDLRSRRSLPVSVRRGARALAILGAVLGATHPAVTEVATMRVWKEAASAECSVVRMSSSGGW